jgi:hypothetical protein
LASHRLPWLADFKAVPGRHRRRDRAHILEGDEWQMLDDLDPLVHQAMAEWQFPGLAIVVVRSTIAHLHRAIEATRVAARVNGARSRRPDLYKRLRLVLA